jgi:predicted  nucleic acid-binding Zn-ribbon protein
MSGCVNCVWDIYREEFEEWKALSKQARERMEAQKASQGDATAVPAAGEGGSMDDDGGGSEALWMEGSAKEEEEEKDPFADVPVGIREFMRTEKMLKERQAAQQASKG